MQHISGSQRGMSRKGQLFLDGEDAHAHAAFFFCRRVSGQDESCLGEVSFAGHGLHLIGAQAAAVEEHG